jgi:hypothetical protein
MTGTWPLCAIRFLADSDWNSIRKCALVLKPLKNSCFKDFFHCYSVSSEKNNIQAKIKKSTREKNKRKENYTEYCSVAESKKKAKKKGEKAIHDNHKCHFIGVTIQCLPLSALPVLLHCEVNIYLKLNNTSNVNTGEKI